MQGALQPCPGIGAAAGHGAGFRGASPGGRRVGPGRGEGHGRCSGQDINHKRHWWCPQGSAATITVGTTSQVAYGGTAAVTNSGTSGAAILDFVLVEGPQGSTGPQGPQGVTGPQGPQGSAATITVGTVTGGTAGGTPTVTNTGTSGAAVLDFVLIPGDNGVVVSDTEPDSPIDGLIWVDTDSDAEFPSAGRAIISQFFV